MKATRCIYIHPYFLFRSSVESLWILRQTSAPRRMKIPPVPTLQCVCVLPVLFILLHTVMAAAVSSTFFPQSSFGPALPREASWYPAVIVGLQLDLSCIYIDTLQNRLALRPPARIAYNSPQNLGSASFSARFLAFNSIFL